MRRESCHSSAASIWEKGAEGCDDFASFYACWVTLALWVGALASLYAINRYLWALAALPIIFAAGQVKLNVPRGRLGFYVYYPVHLAVLWGLARLL